MSNSTDNIDTGTKPMVLIFRPPGANDIPSSVQDKVNQMVDIDRKICNSWTDLTANMKLSPKLIVFYESMIDYNNITVNEFILMMGTFIKCVPECKQTKLVALVGTDTEYSTIKALQKSEVVGIIPHPDDFTTEETLESIKELMSGKQYWPKHILSKLQGYLEPKNKSKEIHLTNRQQQVFDLIAKRGLSNKQIAKALNISESTVKIHVSAIMKHYCVRNRTQLALTK